MDKTMTSSPRSWLRCFWNSSDAKPSRPTLRSAGRGALRAEPGEHQVVREDLVPGGLADLLGGIFQETSRAALRDASAALALHMVVMAIRGLVSAAPIADIAPADQVLSFQIGHGAKDRRVIRGGDVLPQSRHHILDRPRM